MNDLLPTNRTNRIIRWTQIGSSGVALHDDLRMAGPVPFKAGAASNLKRLRPSKSVLNDDDPVGTVDTDDTPRLLPLPFPPLRRVPIEAGPAEEVTVDNKETETTPQPAKSYIGIEELQSFKKMLATVLGSLRTQMLGITLPNDIDELLPGASGFFSDIQRFLDYTEPKKPLVAAAAPNLASALAAMRGWSTMLSQSQQARNQTSARGHQKQTTAAAGAATSTARRRPKEADTKKHRRQ